MGWPDAYQRCAKRDEKGTAIQNRNTPQTNFGLTVISVLLTIQLYFWLFPPGPEGSLDDLIFW